MSQPVNFLSRYVIPGITVLWMLQSAFATDLPLGARQWSIYNSHNMPARPTELADNSGWYFSFPVFAGSISRCAAKQSCPSVNYVATNYAQPLIGSAISMSLEVTADPSTVFQYGTNTNNTCAFPAHVRAYIERKGDDGTNEFYRYWSNPIAYQLAPGSAVVTITTPITPDQWSDVYGQFGSANPAAFQAAVANPTKVGMTFGGGCFFGHGVFVTGGTAQFILTGYRIDP